MQRTLIACALSAIGCAGAADPGGEPEMTPEPIVKPTAQQSIVPIQKPGAPVEIGADVGDATARLQIAFAAAATGVRVEIRGTDGLRVTSAAVPVQGRAVRRGETLLLDVTFTSSEPHSNLGVIVSGGFGGRAMGRAASFTIGELLPPRARALSAGPRLEGVKIAGEAQIR